MKIKRSELIQLANRYIGNDSLEAQNQIMLKIATARCARLSYMTFEGKIDYKKDIILHDQLLAAKHASPFEHCCRAMTDLEYHTFIKGEIEEDESNNNPDIYGWADNFKGFISYRYLIKK